MSFLNESFQTFSESVLTWSFSLGRLLQGGSWGVIIVTADPV